MSIQTDNLTSQIADTRIICTTRQREVGMLFRSARVITLKYFLPKISASLLGMFLMSQALACKPSKEAYDLDAFLASKQADVRIFSAKVLRVKAHSLADGVIEQDAELQLEKSWIGSLSERLVVRTVSGLMAGTSCAKTFDVEMKENERWFVVATLANGNLMVRPLLSQRFTSELDFEQKLKSVEKYVRERKLEDKK